VCGSHARANKVFLIRIGLATLQASTLLGTQKVTDEPCEGSNGWESVTKGRCPPNRPNPAHNAVIARLPATRRFSPHSARGLAPWLSVCLKCRGDARVLGNVQNAKTNCPAELLQLRSAAPAYRIAPGIIAVPREQWAQDLIARLQDQSRA
jgi:hypothetical protein